jgi:hypothetical protein
MALLAIALSLAAPVAQASLNDDLKNLPGDASPKEACHVLIKDGAIKARQEGPCRKLVGKGFEAANKVSNNGTQTIASAAVCAIQALHQKIKQSEMAKCAQTVAETITGGGGGGGFDPVGAVGGFLGGAVDTVTGAIGGAINDTIVAGFKAIIGLLFGGLQSAITVALIKWITTIPNLSGGHVGNLEASVAVGAGGLLAATMTISIVRFWGSGLTGDGAFAGAEGVMRGAIAAVMIGLWPNIFGLAIKLSNALQAGILGSAVQAQLKALFRDLDVIGLAGSVLTGGLIPMFLAIVIAVIGILMLLALVAMKIVITALTIVLFCAMPLAFVVWPIPEMAGITRFCLRSLCATIAIPVVWCLVFGSFAAIGADTFSFSNTGKEEGFMGTALDVAVVKPLVAIALLYLALVLPRRLLQVVPFFNGRPGAIRHIGTGMAVRAGFSYAPQAGKMALGRAQAVGGAMAARFGGGGAAGAGSSGEVAAAGGRREGKASATTSGQAGGPKLREHSSQAAKGGAKPDQNGTGGRESKAGSTNSGKAGGPKVGEYSSQAKAGQSSQKGDTSGYGAMSDEQHAKAMERGDGPFGGPRTMNPSMDRLDAIAKRSQSMAADSSSGSAVSRGQVDAAVSDLKSRPDLLEAARKASFPRHHEETSGAFAEWSLSDNEHVSDRHRSAFSILGSATPSQRKGALGMPGSGNGPGRPSSGPGQSAGDGSGGPGGGRRVPPLEFKSADPPVRRTPHPQPGSNGGG